MTDNVAFAGHGFRLLRSGALHWPAQDALLVADLHLGRSGRVARRGGALLPPFDGIDTMERLAADLGDTGAGRVLSLGDSFDDDAAHAGMDADLRGRVLAVAGARDWTWIAGNHDREPPDLPGRALAELCLGGIWLRHQARAGAGPDISGHYHPKAELAGRSRRALLVGRSHMILPAYGSYTGGLDWTTPVLAGLVGPGLAYLAGSPAVAVPFPPGARIRARR